MSMKLVSELKRRNVFRVAAAYIVAAWLIIQVVETIFPAFGFGDSAVRIATIILAIGLIPALILSWAYEITAEGLKLEKDVDRSRSIAPHTGKKLDRIIMVVLAVSLGYFAIDKFVLDPQRDAERLEVATDEAVEKAFAEVEAALPERSIAVLPFVDLSPEGDQEYFSDGISEELLNLLAKIPGLRVVSRSSAFTFKGKDIDIQRIAEQLKVRHILEGSVRKSGNQLRITAQLIDAQTDTHLWSETYDRAMENIFVIQDDISAAVVEKLKISLLGEAPTVDETDSQAYALFLQANHLNRQSTPESWDKAITLYQEALAIDPDYSPAWNGLAGIYKNQGQNGELPFNEAYRLANRAANRALAIDPEYAAAHARLGTLAMGYDGDLAAAAGHFERALALEPNNISIIGNAGGLAFYLGRIDDAIAANEYVAARDPVNAVAHANLGIKYFDAGRLDEAVGSFRTALTLSPSYIGAHYYIGVALLRQDKALAALEAFQQEPDEEYRIKGTALASYELGLQEDFEVAFRELRERWGEQWPPEIAHVYAWTGDTDAAFEWLEKEYELSGDSTVPEIVADSLFDNIHDNPRWLPFLRKLGKAPEQLAAIKFEVTLPK